MKKIPLFTCLFVVLPFLLMTGCVRTTTPSVFDDEGFNQSLTHVYSNFNIVREAARASGSDGPENDRTDIELLINWLYDVAEEYGVKEVVENSPYYKHLGALNCYEVAGLSDAECMELIRANGSPECIRILTEVADAFIQRDMESILANDRLLPNEKLTFTGLFALLGDEPTDNGGTRGQGGCSGEYTSDKMFCQLYLGIKLLVIGGTAIAIPGTILTAYWTVEPSLDSYKECMDKALVTYKDCLANEVYKGE